MHLGSCVIIIILHGSRRDCPVTGFLPDRLHDDSTATLSWYVVTNSHVLHFQFTVYAIYKGSFSLHKGTVYSTDRIIDLPNIEVKQNFVNICFVSFTSTFHDFFLLYSTYISRSSLSSTIIVIYNGRKQDVFCIEEKLRKQHRNLYHYNVCVWQPQCMWASEEFRQSTVLLQTSLLSKCMVRVN